MDESQYKQTVPKLIGKYKIAIDQCLEIIGMQIDTELSDDKLHNVLKAKRMAGEDAKYYSEQIDILENELKGKDIKKEVTGAEKYARKN
tara:strand:+ start:5309 stop:5575 length:267 start_codon:yes stop_codon:yes gene_type:complete